MKLNNGEQLIDLAKALAAMAKEADMVCVTRCKDCKYGEPNGQYGCKCYHYKLYETHEMTANDFCSRGERGDSDETA